MRAQGYTLVEALVAVAILALLAAAARPLVVPVTEASLDTAAHEVANALRFARSEAIRTGGYRGVDFSVDPGTGLRRIRVFRTDVAVPPNPVYDVYHPLDKKLYDIQLASAPGTSNAALTTAAFLYLAPPSTYVTQDWVAFDSTGMPEYYPAAATYALVTDVSNPAQLTVTLSGRTRLVSLHATTGRVTIQ
jgi:prepilin-type N-terminal cleavage/methylation domain-containing protein